jgi:hypothetical protein
MAHPGWVSLVAGYIARIMTMMVVPVGKIFEEFVKVFSTVGKYPFDKATELKELIAKIDREIDAFKAPPLLAALATVENRVWPLHPEIRKHLVRVRLSACRNLFSEDYSRGASIFKPGGSTQPQIIVGVNHSGADGGHMGDNCSFAVLYLVSYLLRTIGRERFSC